MTETRKTRESGQAGKPCQAKSSAVPMCESTPGQRTEGWGQQTREVRKHLQHQPLRVK